MAKLLDLDFKEEGSAWTPDGLAKSPMALNAISPICGSIAPLLIVFGSATFVDCNNIVNSKHFQ